MTRLTAMREHLGDDFPLMVDANQPWDRPTAMRMCRAMEPFNLVWIEEPLDAYDSPRRVRRVDSLRGSVHGTSECVSDGAA